MRRQDPIGVFDSGLGGISVLHAIQRLMPQENLIFIGDSAHNPYGTKTREEIRERCTVICDWFQEQGCKAIVIACNTATSAAARELRETYPFDVIGMEPALKTACERGPHQKTAVWATDFTLKEEKFARLMHRFDKDHDIRKVPCPRLVRLVEEDRLDDEEEIDRVLREYLEASGPNPDSIVLGCTHFVFFKERLEKLAPGIEIIDGNEGTARHLKELLQEKGLLNAEGGKLVLHNTEKAMEPLQEKLLKRLDTH